MNSLHLVSTSDIIVSSAFMAVDISVLIQLDFTITLAIFVPN